MIPFRQSSRHPLYLNSTFKVGVWKRDVGIKCSSQFSNQVHYVLRCILVQTHEQLLVAALYVCGCIPTPDVRLSTNVIVCESAPIALDVQLPSWRPYEGQRALNTEGIQQERHVKPRVGGCSPYLSDDINFPRWWWRPSEWWTTSRRTA